MSESMEKVNQWLCSAGELPTDQELVDFVKAGLDDWLKERSNGMDVLAGAIVDQLLDVVGELKNI